jgi:hypothetical protein
MPLDGDLRFCRTMLRQGPTSRLKTAHPSGFLAYTSQDLQDDQAPGRGMGRVHGFRGYAASGDAGNNRCR